MKNSSYISGIISLCVVLIATIFKTSHLPGAGILLIVGLGSMSFVFLPISYIQLLKTTHDNLLKWVYHMAFISFLIDFCGMIFKILHWPGASILMLIGIPLPFILFLPMYIIYHNKRNLETDLSFSAILLFMIYLGVFSSFLALSPAKNVLYSSIKTADIINKGNKVLYDALTPNQSSLDMLKKLESLKMELAIHTNEKNKELFNRGDLNQIDAIRGKENKLNYLIYKDPGLEAFNAEYIKFKKGVLAANNSTQFDQLFAEIEIYLIPKGDSEQPALSNLMLIDALNLLTDWENKILLIDYLSNQQIQTKS